MKARLLFAMLLLVGVVFYTSTSIGADKVKYSTTVVDSTGEVFELDDCHFRASAGYGNSYTGHYFNCKKGDSRFKLSWSKIVNVEFDSYDDGWQHAIVKLTNDKTENLYIESFSYYGDSGLGNIFIGSSKIVSIQFQNTTSPNTCEICNRMFCSDFNYCPYDGQKL